MGKKGDLSNFERGIVVGARQASLSNSQSAQLLGISCKTISRVYKEWCEKGKTSNMRQSCERKCLVDAKGLLWPPCTHPATSSRIMHHVTKLESFQIGFLNMTLSSLY